ncbi:MAG: ribosome hibernation-promoting factor, HPF/YfiA family [Micrococcales bacterium]
MQISISARNLTVSERFKDYVAERAHKVEQFAHRANELSIKVTRHDHSRNSGPEDQVELTVHDGGHWVRAEASASDKFGAFDIAFGKLTERLRRAADKRKVHHGHHGTVGTSELSANDFASLDVTPVDGDILAGHPSADLDSDEIDEVGQSPIVIRHKAFKDEPMTVDEALYRMELVGHDFYLFHDAATDKASVVYRRKGWNYGVITLE